MRSSVPADDETDVVTVNVVNHHLLNVVVFNVVQGHRDRLGDVTSASSMSFRLHLRRMVGGELQLYADPVGATRGVTSELLHVSAGDTVDWTLETDLARSHIEIH
ncbi:MAG: hypothetical protein JWM41_4170 [Gemmatimonadetes bacterium]|nr:hypothetical protein [Gemmatimonadota bacterium]